MTTQPNQNQGSQKGADATTKGNDPLKQGSQDNSKANQAKPAGQGWQQQGAQSPANEAGRSNANRPDESVQNRTGGMQDEAAKKGDFARSASDEAAKRKAANS